jgi:hypothetical protein
LVELANLAGGHDNITCVVARVKRLMPRSKPYPLPQLPKDEGYSPDLQEDPTSTMIYEGNSVQSTQRRWLLPLAIILYVVLFGALLLLLRRTGG